MAQMAANIRKAPLLLARSAGLAASVCALALTAPAHAQSKITFVGRLNTSIPPSFTLGTPGSPLPTTQVGLGTLIIRQDPTGLFDDATGWIAANGNPNNQPFRVRDLTGGTPTGRTLDLAFNNFSLAGTCAICGIPLITSANAFGQPDLFPGIARGLYDNDGSGSNVPSISAGTAYGQPPITFSAPGFLGNISFRAIAGGSYRISLTAERVPVPAPLPILGATAAFGWSRRIRKRIRQNKAIAS